MKNRKENLQEVRRQSEEGMSPLELIKLHGGRAHKVRQKVEKGADAMLAVHSGRFTYTFIMNKEVASIHFDQNAGKIFFSGHNISNLNITSDQRNELFNVIKILETDKDGRELKKEYEATLGHIITDNSNGGSRKA